MMRKMPACPKCDEDELWLYKHALWVELRCYNCGLIETIAPRPPADDALDNAIAEVVRAAQKNVHPLT